MSCDVTDDASVDATFASLQEAWGSLDFVVHDDPSRRADLAASCEIPAVVLSDEEIRLLMEFLHALTDPSSIDLRGDVPMRVPSGDPVAD